MKRYSIMLFIIVVIGFSIPIMIFYKACTYVPFKPKAQVFNLNTAKMRESTISDTFSGLFVDTIFPCNKINNANDTVSWADLYLCHTHLKNDSLIVLLDTHTRGDLDEIKDPSNYWTKIKFGKRLDKCKILVSPDLIGKIKNYHYKYGSVTLVTDD